MLLWLAPIAGFVLGGGLALARGSVAGQRLVERVSPPPYPLAVLAPAPGNPQTEQRIRALADRIRRVWPDLTSAELTPAALEVLLAQAGGEGTGYGQGWGGDMAGSNNVGSYQVGSGPRDTSYFRGVDHVDHKPDGTPYTTPFRYYINGTTPDGKSRDAGDAGAWDFVRSVVVKPFPALPAILSGSVLNYAFDQGVNGYFEGFDPETPMGGNVKDWQTRWADSIRYLLAKNPTALARRAAKVKATPERVAGRMAFYARGMGHHLPVIAHALGHERVYATLPKDLS